MINPNTKNILGVAGESFFLTNYNFTKQLIVVLNERYRTELKKNINLDFSFRFYISEKIFNEINELSILDDFDRGLGKSFPPYIDTRKSILFSKFKENLKHYIVEEKKDVIYFDREKLSFSFLRLFGEGYENPKESIERFVKKKNNDLNLGILESNVFHKLDIDLFQKDDELTLLNLPYLKNKNILDIKRKIDLNPDFYKPKFTKIYLDIRENMDIKDDISIFKKQISSYRENMKIIIKEENNNDKKYKIINSFRKELIKIRDIFLDKNIRNVNNVKAKGERNLNNQINRYIRYFEVYQKELFDDLIPEDELNLLRENDLIFKREIKILNNEVLYTINILKSELDKLDELSDWEYIYLKYKKSDFAKPAELKIKEDLLIDKCHLLVNEIFDRTQVKTKKMLSEMELEDRQYHLDRLLDFEYKEYDLARTDDELDELDKLDELRKIKADKKIEKEYKIKNLFLKILTKYTEENEYSIYDFKEEMNQKTFPKMIYYSRNKFNGKKTIKELKEVFKEEALEYKIDVEKLLKNIYKKYFEEIEEKRFTEAKERRLKWNENIL